MAAPKQPALSLLQVPLSAAPLASQTFEFPVPALGLRMSVAASAVAEETQAPVELVAHHLLALAAMSAQRVATLRLPTGQGRPLSCYFLTVAGTGERKSAAEDAVVDPVRLWEQERLDRDEAGPAYDPSLFWTPPSRAGNRYALCRAQYGLFAQQSAEVIADGPRRLAEAASLCALWDGRSEKGCYADVYVPRFSFHLVATPRDAGRLLSDLDLGDAGVLGRVLAAAPASLVGGRRCGTPAATAAYEDLCDALLARYAAEVTAHHRVLSFSNEADAAWISFAAEVEAAMAPGKPLAPIVGLASRLPEHAARLAGVIALVEDADTSELGAEALGRGIALARFYAWEALRISELHAPAEGAQAEILLDWLQRHRAGQRVCVRDVCRVGPKSMRHSDDAYRLMRRLERQGLVNVANDDVGPSPAVRRSGIVHEWCVPASANAEKVSPSVA